LLSQLQLDQEEFFHAIAELYASLQQRGLVEHSGDSEVQSPEQRRRQIYSRRRSHKGRQWDSAPNDVAALAASARILT
jgi:hypothetical protein